MQNQLPSNVTTRWLKDLQRVPVIAVIRSSQAELALTLAQIALQAGIHSIEITTTTPHFIEIIAQLHQDYPDRVIGLGTVLDRNSALAAIEVGAQFLIGPITIPEVIELADYYPITVVPGALTPQEIWQAFAAGVSVVKVFPVVSLGGPTYIRHLLNPLHSWQLIPTGGVTMATARDYLAAGAVAVAMGGDLFPPAWIEVQNWEGIRQRIRHLLAQLSSQDL